MSHEYFENLNYTMANEDTQLEYTLLPEQTRHVLVIAGSGSRVLPLLAKQPKRLSISDYSQEQLALTKTRIETVRSLNYQEFLAFWGYPTEHEMGPVLRQEIFHRLDLPLKDKEIMASIFKQNEWKPLLYKGKYEKAIIKLSKLIQTILGHEHIERLKSFDDHYKFQTYLKNDFPRLKWKLLVTVLGNSTMLNALLYKGQHPKKNIDITYSQYYNKMFEKLFSIFTPKESFFLQLILFGGIKKDGATPYEADPSIFEQMKKGIEGCEIDYYQGDLFSNIEKLENNIDFVSFSDILSYFPEDLEEVYLQKIKKKLNPKALTVHRYYFHINRNLDTSGFTKMTEAYPKLINKEKTQIYIIDIYQRNPHV